MDVSLLTQAGPIIISLETDAYSEETNSWDSEEEPCRGLEGLDLSDYLLDRAEYDALDAVITVSSDPTESSSSFADCSAAH